MLVDSHCHLDFEDFSSELPEVLARARAAGLVSMICIGSGVLTERVMPNGRQAPV